MGTRLDPIGYVTISDCPQHTQDQQQQPHHLPELVYSEEPNADVQAI